MMRYFEWQWALPRMALVAFVVMGVSYLLGLGARSAAVRTGEQLFGSAVEVSHARVPLASGCVELSGLRVSDPAGSAEPWIEADYCQLEVALKPLMTRQVVIDRGRMYGLRFGGQSQTHNQQSPKSPRVTPTKTLFGDSADEKARTWLASLDGRFRSEVVKELETIKRSDVLCARWATQTASLEERATAIKKQADGLQQSAVSAESNRLRHTTTMNDIPTRIATVREEVQKLSADFEKLPEQLENGRREIVAARRHDEQLLRERMKFESIEQEALTAYLLREQVATSIQELVDWLRCGRQFAGTKQGHVIVRSLEFQGQGRLFGQTVDVRGLLTDFSTQPGLMKEPMRLRMKTTGAMPLQVRATFDNRQPTVRDELFVNCREWRLPEVTLGRPDELQLKLSPSTGSMTVSLRMDGNHLSGDVQLVQKQVQITSALGGELPGAPLAAPLQASLSDVHSLATHVTLSGTVDAPTCTLWSNLGPAVAEAMDRALVRCGEEHAAQILAESRRQVDERLAALERQVAEQRAKFAKDTLSLPQRLDSIARQQTRRERISTERLGGRLPNSSLFLR
jgi:hypothetical protein